MLGTTELTKLIHRPLTELEEGLDGYMHGRSALYMFSKTRRESEVPLWAQRNMSSLYRVSLARKGLDLAEAVDDPRGVPESRRSPEWRELCALIDAWDDLPRWRQVSLARALMIMSYHRLALDLTEKLSRSLDPMDEWDAQLMLANGQCRVVLHFEAAGRRTAYDPKPLSQIVARTPTASFARFKALNHLIMLYAQLVQDEAAAAEHAAAMADCARALAEQHKGTAVEHLLMSNLYRVTSMVPFMRQDRAGVAAEMAEAEAHAAAAVEADPDEFLATENLYSLCETRTREAIWIGDLDRAEEAAKRLIRLTPLDSKAWIELGEALYKHGKLEAAARAYITATWLGPPGLDIAYLMAGQCYGALGEDDLAKHYLMASFAHDDEEPSAAEALRDISESTGDDLVTGWLEALQTGTEARQ